MSVPADVAVGNEPERSPPAGKRGLDGRLRPGWPALIGLALGLLALGPGLARGFLLDYDMVFVPRPPFSAALLGARGFSDIRVSGARYHDVPGPLRPIDRAFCAWPSAASILLVRARKT